MKTFKRTEALAEAVEKDPEGFAKWVAALRSGKYEQIQRKMTVPGKEETCGCCLHILQLAHGLEGKASILPSEEEPSSAGWPDVDRGQISTLAGFDVSRDTVVRVVEEDGHWRMRATFSGLNDKYRLNFDQIADIIEGKVVTL